MYYCRIWKKECLEVCKLRKVNVRDLFFYLLTKWYFIVLIGAVIAACFCVNYYMNYDKGYVLNDELKEKLDKVEELKTNYDEFQTSNEKTGILTMDTYNYYFVRVSYKLTGYPIDSTVYDLIIEEIKDDDFKKKIVETSGANIDEKSLGFLVNVWKEDFEDGTVVYYDFKTSNKDDAEAVCQAAEEMMGQVGERYAARNEDAEWILDNSSVSNFTNDGVNYLRPAVSNFEKAMEKAEEDYDDIISSLSEKEKITYKIYYLNEELELSKRVLAKKTIVGLILGCAIGIGVCGFVYMFNSKIRTVEEMQKLYGLSIVGLLDKNRNYMKRSKLDKLRYRFDSEDFVKAFLMSIEGSVVVLYDYDNDDSKSIVEALSGNNLTSSSYLHTNVDIKSISSKYDKAVLIVKLNSIKYREIDREIEVCSMRGVDIVGVVAVV